jgi:beta-lactamase class D
MASLLMVACRGNEAAISPSRTSSTPDHSQSPPLAETQEFVVEPGFARLLEERDLTGSIAIYDAESGRFLCSHEGACDEPFQPASTYKIPHSLIGLELGELTSAEHEFKWDGVEYPVVDWNRDHTLRSAMEVSCVPCFQQLARRIGEERMRESLEKLDYGNATLGAPIDEFWLEPGALRISQRQQIIFLKRLRNQELPFSRRAMAATLDIIPKKAGSDYVLHGKTGLLRAAQSTGWYVGYLEWSGGVTYFATVLTGSKDAEQFIPARREVSVATLRQMTGMSHLE